MAFIFVDTDNSLAIQDVYAHRKVVSDIGGSWDPVSKLWRVAFTTYNLDFLLNNLDNPSVSADMEHHVALQTEKETKLSKIRAMSKQDMPVRFKIPGLKCNLYNYQRLGVMFATTNGTGTLLADEMGLGKGKVVGSYVFTTNGPVKIETLKVGDFVIGKNGMAVRVIGVYPQPIQDVYKITFSDGFSTVVDASHLWEVYHNNNLNTNRETDGVVLSTQQLLDRKGFSERRGTGYNKDKIYRFKTYYKKPNGGNKWSIPIVDPIGFESKNITIDPYMLGVFLGDGHITYAGYVKLEMLKKDLKEMALHGKRMKCRKPHMSIVSFTKYTGELKRLGLNGKKSWEKFIPKEYKYNSIDVRLKVLQGLMDADGNAADCATEYCTTSKRLCDDVVEIVQTLGGIARVRVKKKPSYKYKGVIKYGRLAYRVNIKLPSQMSLFGLQRKVDNYDVCCKYLPARYICNIQKQKKQKKTICIAVDAPDSLYVTEHCIVTHNTLQAIGAAVFLKAQGKAKNALIVTPASLKFNWPIEIEKFTNEKYVVIDGTPDERIAQWLRSDVFFTIVNYELILEDLFGGREYKDDDEDSVATKVRKAKLSEKAKQRERILTPVRARMWDFLAVDEAHALKSHNSRRSRNIKMLRAKFRMALTGTPMDGRLEELHSVMGFVAPGLLGSKSRFFQMHIETDFWGKVTGYKRLGEVSKRIEPYFIRRLKKDVLKDLPDKIYENRMVSLTPQEKKIYTELAEGGHSVTEDAQAIVACIRCKQFCNWPPMIDEDCKHTSKMDSMKEVLEEVVIQNGHKALIFSQYKTMLDIIAAKLKELGLTYLRIDGDTDKQERAKMQVQFNTDPKIDLMIGTEAMSTGLNFTGADYVINYDDNWSPSIMGQREDRTHRIGQKNVVTVVNFICRDTIEERIRAVIYGKNRITSEVLGDATDEMVLKRMNPKEICQLL